MYKKELIEGIVEQLNLDPITSDDLQLNLYRMNEKALVELHKGIEKLKDKIPTVESITSQW